MFGVSSFNGSKRGSAGPSGFKMQVGSIYRVHPTSGPSDPFSAVVGTGQTPHHQTTRPPDHHTYTTIHSTQYIPRYLPYLTILLSPPPRSPFGKPQARVHRPVKQTSRDQGWQGGPLLRRHERKYNGGTGESLMRGFSVFRTRPNASIVIYVV